MINRLSSNLGSESSFSVSSHGELFIKYECFHSKIFRNDGFAWWVSRNSTNMTYWSGASVNGNCLAGWPTHVRTPVMAVTVIRMTMLSLDWQGKVSSKTSQVWRCWSFSGKGLPHAGETEVLWDSRSTLVQHRKTCCCYHVLLLMFWDSS